MAFRGQAQIAPEIKRGIQLYEQGDREDAVNHWKALIARGEHSADARQCLELVRESDISAFELIAALSGSAERETVEFEGGFELELHSFDNADKFFEPATSDFQKIPTLGSGLRLPPLDDEYENSASGVPLLDDFDSGTYVPDFEPPEKPEVIMGRRNMGATRPATAEVQEEVNDDLADFFQGSSRRDRSRVRRGSSSAPGRIRKPKRPKSNLLPGGDVPSFDEFSVGDFGEEFSLESGLFESQMPLDGERPGNAEELELLDYGEDDPFSSVSDSGGFEEFILEDEEVPHASSNHGDRSDFEEATRVVDEDELGLLSVDLGISGSGSGGGGLWGEIAGSLSDEELDLAAAQSAKTPAPPSPAVEPLKPKGGEPKGTQMGLPAYTAPATTEPTPVAPKPSVSKEPAEVLEVQELVDKGELVLALVRAEEYLSKRPIEQLKVLAENLSQRLEGMAVEILKPLDRVPRLLVPPAQVFSLKGIDHRGGFLLSQVDGVMDLEFLIDSGAMHRAEAAMLLLLLKERGVVTF